MFPGTIAALVPRLYDVDDGSLVKEIPVSGRADADTRWLFDDLANQMLGLAGGAPSNRKVQVARITTASVEAYRHYLHGARSLHAWNLEAADSAFDRATTIDSTTVPATTTVPTTTRSTVSASPLATRP